MAVKHDSSKVFTVLTPDKKAHTIPNSPDVFNILNQQFGSFKNHELIACFEFESDWSNWELHPKGDETVVLLTGKVTFVLEIENQHQEVELDEAGEFLIVPKGVWHTARTNEKSKVLFITPGEGTEHKEI